jgi:predicted Zn-dependent peptidase
MAEFHWAEVDGVATVWAETAGPLRAGLLFRTGRADETLITAGHTHLIEHMTLSAMNANAQTSNGFVGGINTGFITIGSPEDVSTFLMGVCRALQSLPADRLEAEKQILMAESAARHYDFRTNLLTSLFGAAGYGLLGMAELGFRGATLEQLQQRREKWFTRDNAILWLSGPIPAGLRLDLPAGTKQPLPPLTPIQSTFPVWFVDEMCGGIAAGATVPRVAASSLFLAIAHKRLHEQLRTKQAVSYSPMVFYEPLNAETAHLILYADSDQKRRDELTKAFGEIYEKLTEVDEAEVEAAKKQYIEQTTGSLAPPPNDRIFFEIQRVAMNWLLGREHDTLEKIVEEAMSVRAADISDFARGLQQKAVLAVPANVNIHPWMGKKSFLSNGAMVKGREVLSVDAPIQLQRLIYGSDGVSMRWGDGSRITVLYSDLAAALHFDDGCLHLIASNASWITIEPTLWQNGVSICREIREQIPAHLLIEQGARSADKIPKPTTTAWQRFRASLGL